MCDIKTLFSTLARLKVLDREPIIFGTFTIQYKLPVPLKFWNISKSEIIICALSNIDFKQGLTFYQGQLSFHALLYFWRLQGFLPIKGI